MSALVGVIKVILQSAWCNSKDLHVVFILLFHMQVVEYIMATDH